MLVDVDHGHPVFASRKRARVVHPLETNLIGQQELRFRYVPGCRPAGVRRPNAAGDRRQEEAICDMQTTAIGWFASPAICSRRKLSSSRNRPRRPRHLRRPVLQPPHDPSEHRRASKIAASPGPAVVMNLGNDAWNGAACIGTANPSHNFPRRAHVISFDRQEGPLSRRHSSLIGAPACRGGIRLPRPRTVI